MLILITAVSLAILVSFFCSLSEAALYSISWSRIENLRREKRRSGDILFQLRQDVERPISAILTLNTLANTAGASVAGAAAGDALGSESLVMFAVIFTILILIFGEIIPKTIGVLYAKQVGPLLARPILWLVVLLTPTTWLLSFVVGLLKSKHKGPHTTEEDIKAIVSLTRKAGLLQPYEELSIRNILSLDKKSVEQIMTPRTVVFTLHAGLTVQEAMKDGNIWPHSRVPVWDEDAEDIVGVVYRRDVLGALAGDRHQTVLSTIMKPAEFVLESLTLDRALIKFLESRIHMFVVLDEYGGFSGVITLEDVLEEILGKEIVDETDQVADMRELARQRRRSAAERNG